MFGVRLPRLLRAFVDAARGLFHALASEPNARIHAFATVLVVALGAALGVSRADWIALVLAIGLVWVAELANTAVERVVDLCSPEHHPLAGAAKDVGASAALVASITAVVVGLLVLGPPLLALLAARLQR